MDEDGRSVMIRGRRIDARDDPDGGGLMLVMIDDPITTRHLRVCHLFNSMPVSVITIFFSLYKRPVVILKVFLLMPKTE
jgi:hypothetical protein